MICPNCHKELPNDARFCDACGTPLVAETAQPEPIPEPQPMYEPQPEPQPEFVVPPIPEPQPVQQTYEPQPVPQQMYEQPPQQWENMPPMPPQKKSKKKFFVIGGIAAGVAAIAVAVVLLIMNMGGGGRTDYALYLKDGEICYTDFTENGRMELTDRLFSSGKPSAEEMSYFGTTLSYRVAFSADGKRVFYCDRSDTGSGFTLYFRDLSRPKIEPIKLDSDVRWSFAINSAGTEVFYTKSDGSLYRHDLMQREKIASDTYDSFGVADDCKKIFYGANYSYDSGTFDIYLWHANGEKVKLASDVSAVPAASADMSVLYYLRDDALYRQVEGADEREKLAGDIYNLICCYPDGQAYYTRMTAHDHTLAEFVIDDMAASDAMMVYPEYPTYPEYPEYPNWWEYDDDELYDAAVEQWNIDYDSYVATCNLLEEGYYAALNEYELKRERDYLREALAEQTITLCDYTLYYFDGTTETKLCDSYDSYWDVASDAPVLVFFTTEKADTATFMLTDISWADEVWDALTYSEGSREYMIAVGANVSGINEGNSFTAAPDGSCVYYFTQIGDTYTYDLWRLPIDGGSVGTAEKRDSDVAVSGSCFVGDTFVYYKDVNGYYNNYGYSGELYIDGVPVDYDVWLWSVNVGKDGALYYYTDYNSERSFGTLKRYAGGEKIKISDDVREYTTSENGDVLYLFDFSQNSHVGTLCRFSNGKVVKIDDDVSAIIPIMNNVDKYYEKG